MNKTLNFKIVVKCTATEAHYACEYSETVFNAMPPDAIITVYSKSCRQLANGTLVQRGKTTKLWHKTGFHKNALTYVSAY